MSLQTYSQEELKNMPMIDIASLILYDEKEALHFKEIFEKVAEIKGYSEQQKTDLIAQFYTDLNIDGRFITTGANLWGLKRWYPADKMDEQVSNPSKRTAVTEEDDDLDIVDEEMDDLIDDIDEEVVDEEDLETEGFDEDPEDEFGELEADEFPAYAEDDED